MKLRRTLAAAAATIAVAGAAGACGVPIDDEPRVIERPAAPVSTQAPTTIVGGSQQVAVYFLRDDRLERQTYGTDGEPTIRDALRSVLEPPAEGSDAGLRTAVPPGTTLRSVEVTDGVATVDLSGAMNDVSGTAQKEAFAQVAFTALEVPGVEEVRFLLDGELIDAPTDDGNVANVSARNYDEPLNPR